MQAQTTNQDDDFTPLPDNYPLPTMLTLYRRDMLYLSNDDLSERVRHCLDIPFKIACWLCKKYPALWCYAMDFMQEGNIQLLEADNDCDISWDIERFAAYVGSSVKGCMYQYLSRTFDIYIPPTMRHRMVKERGQGAQVELIEHHLSWETLLIQTGKTRGAKPDKSSGGEHLICQTNVQAAFQYAAREKLEKLLDQLPSRERYVLTLYYGLDGHAHSSTEIAQLLCVCRDQAKLLVNQALLRLRHEQVKPAREHINQNRVQRLQQIYEQYGGNIGSVQLSILAKCHTKTAAKFMRMRREAEEHMPASLIGNA